MSSYLPHTFNRLRFPLTIAVIFIHNFPEADSFSVSQLKWLSLSFVDLLHIVEVAFSHILCHLAVPTFFLISGFLFFYKIGDSFTKAIYLAKMRRRVKTLLIPYILWNLLAISLIVSMKLLGVLLHGNEMTGVYEFLFPTRFLHYFWDSASWSPNRVNVFDVTCPMTAPIDVPLWYIRNLMVVCLATPVIYFIVKRLKLLGMILFVVLYLFNLDIPISGFSIQAFTMFTIGAYMSICKVDLVSLLWKIRYVLLMGLIAVFLYLFSTDGNISFLHSLSSASFMVVGSLLLIGTVMRLTGKTMKWGGQLLVESNFFIYASHTLVVLDISRWIVARLFVINHVLQSYMIYFLSPIVCVAICICLYLLLKKSNTKILELLTGARC